MHAFLRYGVRAFSSRAFSSGAFFVAAVGFAFAGCDGTSNSHSDGGLVTVGPGGGAAGGASGSSGAGSGAGGEGHGGVGRGGSDAGVTDGSGVLDASQSNLDASDAAQGCGCVQQTITWYPKSTAGEGPHSTLSSCAQFTEDPPPASDARASCTIDLANCDGGISVGLIQEAVMLPGVQMALASAPVAYGLIGAGHPSTRVEIGGKIVDIGDMCPTTASSCVPVPTDVLAFKALLNDFRSEQLAKDPCSALFTHNGDTCVERKRESTQVLVMIEGHLQHSCASVDDCTLFSPSSDCTARCEQVVSRTEAQQLKDVIASINTQFCVNYEQDCGPVFIPPCTPPGAPACVNNQCVMQ